MKLPRGPRVVIFLLSIIVILFLLEKVELPDDTLLWREIQNTGHTPLFGFLTLIFLWVLVSLPKHKRVNPLWFYLGAFMGASIVGAGSEYLQIVGPRDADFWDIIRNMAGIVAFPGIYMAFDKRLSDFWRIRGQGLRIAVLSMMILILAASFTPLVLLKIDYFRRNAAFPVICAFDSRWENRFLRTEGARLEFVAPAGKLGDLFDSDLAKTTFKVSKYASLVIEEPVPDWNSYDSLVMTVYSDADTSIDMGIRIDDAHYEGISDDRFVTMVVISKGINNVAVSMDDIRAGPESRFLDTGHIARLILFASKPQKEFILYFDNIRLK